MSRPIQPCRFGDVDLRLLRLQAALVGAALEGRW